MVIADTRPRIFYGWRVVGAAFVLAVFGWGLGFYGPPVFLSVLRETKGWPLPVISMVEKQRLYASIGYEETGRGSEAGYDRVFMRKQLRD
jgi:hypothetical protein